MANPSIIAQGKLNRLRGSIQFADNPNLNVTQPYLARTGISIAFDGDTSKYIPTSTGAVISQEPYVISTVTINLLKTNGLGEQYKEQWEANSAIGDLTIQPDTSAMTPFTIVNAVIQNVGEMAMNGEQEAVQVRLQGIYYINNDMWNLT